jgi:hypothetical protein
MSEDNISEALDCASRDHQRRMGIDLDDREEQLRQFLATKGLSPQDIQQACSIEFGGGGGADELHETDMERAKEGIDDDPTGPPGQVAQAAGQRLAPGGGNVGFGQSDQGPPLNNGLQRLVQLVNALEEPTQQDEGMHQEVDLHGAPVGHPPRGAGGIAGAPMPSGAAPKATPAQDAALSVSEADANAFYRRFPHAAKIGGHFPS